jgi:hypothetical protein
MGPFGGKLVGVAIGTAGVLLTLGYFKEEVTTMEGQHWFMVVIMLVVGYVLGRLWTQPAQMLGLP